MKYLSVCSGIEAVSVAWQPLGWQPVMFAEIDPFCCWLLRSRYGASRPLHMPSPHAADTRQEAKQRAAAIRNVIALPINSAVVNFGDFTQIGKDGSAQESVRGRDFRGFCLSAGIGYSPPDARQRLDAGIGVAGLQGVPA